MSAVFIGTDVVSHEKAALVGKHRKTDTDGDNAACAPAAIRYAHARK